MKNLIIVSSLIFFAGCVVISKKSNPIITTNIDTTDSPNYRFGKPFNEFELKVPENYNHFTQLDSFNRAYYQTVTIRGYMADKYFINSSNKLVPGNSYIVKFYPILKRVSTQECIDFMLKENAILVNAQGLTLAWSLMSKKFPIDKGWILSLDYKNSLSQSPDVKFEELRIPIWGLNEFATYTYNTPWDPNFACLLGFFEKKEYTR